MDSKDIFNIYEAYNSVYEQKIGVPLKDSSDRAAREQLKKMIPKGEKVYTPKSSLQNAAYEPEGEYVEEDMYDKSKEFDNFDIMLEYLVAEGYADTNENALVIMANMSEEWKNIILEK